MNAGLTTRGQEGQLLQGTCIALREGNAQGRCCMGYRELRYDAIRTDGKDAISVSRSHGSEQNECDEKRDAFHAA